tara:strand:+ start:704 stop:2476 length:1773 start_codon:yes stop_codon:yes gene_type:complete
MKYEINKVIIGHSNTFHDPSLAVCYKDKIYAEGLERLSQNKRSLFSVGDLHSLKGLKKTLKERGIPIENPVELTLRTTWKPPFYIRGLAKIFNSIYRRVAFFNKKRPFLFDDCQSFTALARYSQTWYLKGLPVVLFQLRKFLWGDYLHKVSHKKTTHHLTHAANAVYTSTFNQCAVMILDGAGEEISCSFYHFKNNNFKLIYKSRASLGYLYAAVTECCGFSCLHGEEWKVMGLSAYGKFNQEIYYFFKEKMKVKGIKLRTNFGPRDKAKLNKIVGGFRKPADKDVLKSADLAYNFQKAFSDTVIELANQLQVKTGEKNLAYGGGCALNSLTNGRILEEAGFDQIHIPSAPGDDGNSLGALLYQKYHINKMKRSLKWPVLGSSPYLGSEPDIDYLKKILDYRGVNFQEFDNKNLLTKKVATLLANGKILGWVQGRAEFGPRALGNRSILADPRKKEMKEKINSRIKGREFYRPIAPSILHEFGQDYFKNYVKTPYMEKALFFKESVRSLVPAVVHKDGSGRLQSVHKELNPLYHQLISDFYQITKVPILVNTSLNVMGRPIIHSIEDALTTFLTTDLDYLVIDNFLIKKN